MLILQQGAPYPSALHQTDLFPLLAAEKVPIGGSTTIISGLVRSNGVGRYLLTMTHEYEA